jgi:hypothetical protein
LPLSFAVGRRTFICDNLALSSDIVIAKRHTKKGGDRFREGIAQAVSSLGEFAAVEKNRIGWLRQSQLDEDKADAVLLRSFEKGIVGARLLPQLIEEWRCPRYEEFAPRTAYSMLNCYTEVMKNRLKAHPHRASHEIMNFQSLLLN